MAEDGKKKRIAVSGATGNQGGKVVDALLARGNFIPVAIVRDLTSDSAKKLAKKGCELVKGDLLDEASLVSALNGVDGFYLVTVPIPFNETGCVNEIKQGKTAVAAAKKAGVPFTVFSSVGGAERDSKVPHFDSKFEIEKSLKASGLKHFVVRPAAFMDNLLNPEFGVTQGSLQGIVPGSLKVQYIATEDIGEFVAIGFSDPEKYAGTSLEIAGEDITGDQQVALMSKLRGGEPFAYSLAPMFILEYVAPEMYKMAKFFEKDGYHADIPKLKEMHPKLLDTEAFLKKRGFPTMKLKQKDYTPYIAGAALTVGLGLLVRRRVKLGRFF